ncbi:MAG: Gfo/Idh/MocA family oxidoreductase [Petrimonas sp.]|jgi:predicted dehydrogenase|uniref:Gfo/Idh/MocA family protein n=1 Tax=Petrimonas sp. TaxID=2023866 RepID=UPI002B3BB4A8|nr:Gfo/Idh/MocA family oxidoreductase [Petrimonas sp.]
MNKKTTRRKFIKNLTLGTATVYSVPLFSSTGTFIRSLNSSINMNSNIQIALIGKGGMGTADTNTALSIDGVKLMAVCDLYDKRLDEAKNQWGSDLFLTKDYKEILTLKDIDAIIIATPDHWHQPIAIEAMNAGKHIYCEKPIIHKLDEGKKLVEAQQKNKTYFQIGSQGMASIGNKIAKILIKNGIIGKVNLIDGQFTSAPGMLNSFKTPEGANQKTIWWERFLGNAPKIPFDAQRFLAWRNWKDYGTTIAGDLFVHVISSVHYIMGALGPEKVYTTGGIHHYTDGSRDVPDIMLGYFDYPDRNNLGAFTLSLGANYVDGISNKWGSTNFRINGSFGSLEVGWNEVKLKTTYDLDEVKADIREEAGKDLQTVQKISPREYVYKADDRYKGGHYQHFLNFFNGIRNDTPLTADVFFGVRSSAPALLSNESSQRNQALYWDAEKLNVKS